MGYTTTFIGAINIDPPIDPATVASLNAWMRTDHSNLESAPGGFGGYCDYEITADGASIRWNGSEKSYDMPEWLEWLIEHEFAPNGHTLNGALEAYGEEPGDIWVLHVKDNVVSRKQAKITF